MTAMHAAAARNHSATVQRLFSLGCPVDGVNMTGETALHLALAFNHLTTVKTLLQLNAPLNAKTGRMSRRGASEQQQATATAAQSARGGKAAAANGQQQPSAPSTSGGGRAAANGHATGGRLAPGAKRGSQSRYEDGGFSPLINTRQYPDLDDLYLLARPAPATLPPYSCGLTPLHLAACINSHDLVVMLLAAGADANSRNNVNETPLEYACKHSMHTHLDPRIDILLLNPPTPEMIAMMNAAAKQAQGPGIAATMASALPRAAPAPLPALPNPYASAPPGYPHGQATKATAATAAAAHMGLQRASRPYPHPYEAATGAASLQPGRPSGSSGLHTPLYPHSIAAGRSGHVNDVAAGANGYASGLNGMLVPGSNGHKAPSGPAADFCKSSKRGAAETSSSEAHRRSAGMPTEYCVCCVICLALFPEAIVIQLCQPQTKSTLRLSM